MFAGTKTSKQMLRRACCAIFLNNSNVKKPVFLKKSAFLKKWS